MNFADKTPDEQADLSATGSSLQAFEFERIHYQGGCMLTFWGLIGSDEFAEFVKTIARNFVEDPNSWESKVESEYFSKFAAFEPPEPEVNAAFNWYYSKVFEKVPEEYRRDPEKVVEFVTKNGWRRFNQFPLDVYYKHLARGKLDLSTEAAVRDFASLPLETIKDTVRRAFENESGNGYSIVARTGDAQGTLLEETDEKLMIFRIDIGQPPFEKKRKRVLITQFMIRSLEKCDEVAIHIHDACTASMAPYEAETQN
jgi:hypothetical protein